MLVPLFITVLEHICDFLVMMIIITTQRHELRAYDHIYRQTRSVSVTITSCHKTTKNGDPNVGYRSYYICRPDRFIFIISYHGVYYSIFLVGLEDLL
jgi:hypothetical protein